MNTLEKVNIAILPATITCIIAINSLLSGMDHIGPGLRWFITFLTSVGVFRLPRILVYWLIRAFDTLLAVYHRRRFLKGLWIYRYEGEGGPHMGIWRSGRTFMRAQSVFYGHNEEGVRQADIILRRADRGQSEARIVEEMCGPPAPVPAVRCRDGITETAL